jgi:hypothetical protein
MRARLVKHQFVGIEPQHRVEDHNVTIERMLPPNLKTPLDLNEWFVRERLNELEAPQEKPLIKEVRVQLVV